MPVQCRIILPGKAQLEDIMMVIGILAGHPVKKDPFTTSDGYSVEFTGKAKKPKFKPFDTNDGSTGQIFIEWKTPKETQTRYGTFCFEGEEYTEAGDIVRRGNKSFSPNSHPFWVAVGRKLVDFFGGYMVANDSDDSGAYKRRSPRWLGKDSDGRPWYLKQEAFLKLKPLTEKDLEAVLKLAAYGDPEDLYT